MKLNHSVILALLVITFIVFFVGPVGFHYVEGWSWLDSFYTTIITLTTVGYGDFTPATASGKLLVVGLVLTGLGTMSYTLVEVTAFVMEGHLNRYLRRRRVNTMVRKISKHFIVCGMGNTGRYLVEELKKNNVPFVVIDSEPEMQDNPLIKGHPFLLGDATDDETLQLAGVDKALGLAATLQQDEQNLFLVITAKNLNPNIRCVSKTINEKSRAKMLRAGADAVVSTSYIGGLRMASELIRPNVVSFLDIMLRHSKGVRFEEALLPQNGSQVGKTLAELDLYGRFGLTPLAVREKGEAFTYNPDPQYRMQANDTLVVISEPSKLKALRTFLKS